MKFCMKMARWEGWCFFLKKRVYCLSFIQNFIKVQLHIRRAEISERKFNDTARFTAPLFDNVTSISNTAVARNRAKGLRLHERTRTWSSTGKSITVPLKKKPTQLKATHREVPTTISPKVRKLAVMMGFFVQMPIFATNYLVLPMNSQRYDVLHRPTL
jgi:hypothetical protein